MDTRAATRNTPSQLKVFVFFTWGVEWFRSSWMWMMVWWDRAVAAASSWDVWLVSSMRMDRWKMAYFFGCEMWITRRINPERFNISFLNFLLPDDWLHLLQWLWQQNPSLCAAWHRVQIKVAHTSIQPSTLTKIRFWR